MTSFLFDYNVKYQLYHHHHQSKHRNYVDRPGVSDCVMAGDPPESECGNFLPRPEILRVWIKYC